MVQSVNLCSSWPVDWVDKELWVAAFSGTCTGVGVMIPMAFDRSVSWLGLLIFPAFIGAVVGLMMGLVAVGGGRYALWTNRVWPAGSHSCWRHRFAACTACAVILVVAGVLCWAVVVTGDVSLGGAGFFPESWIVLAGVAALSYLFAHLLAPARDARQELTATE